MNPAFEAALEIIRALRNVGCTSYFVGGCVRDMLLETPLGDIDIATDASPTILTTLFPKTLTIGAAFGITVIQHRNLSFEVSTFRSDGNYSNGRHPDQIRFSSIKEDALRRDFTINGLFYDPDTQKIYDYVNGRDDLKRKIIRTIGLPRQRFAEDKLRLIRAIRFAAKLNFELEEKTAAGIIKEAPTVVSCVSVERIWHELKKMAGNRNFTTALSLLHRLGLLKAIFPELKKQTPLHIKKTINSFEGMSLEFFPPILILQPLFTSLESNDIERSFRRLKISNKEWGLFKKWHALLPHLSPVKTDHIFWTHFFSDPDSDLLLKFAVGQLSSQDEKMRFFERIQYLKEKLENHILRLTSNMPLISAFDLMARGIPKGKLLGDLLKEAENLTIENNYRSKEEVLSALKLKGFWK